MKQTFDELYSGQFSDFKPSVKKNIRKALWMMYNKDFHFWRSLENKDDDFFTEKNFHESPFFRIYFRGLMRFYNQ